MTDDLGEPLAPMFVDTVLSEPAQAASPIARRHLLVFHEVSSWMHPLPTEGEIVIGRAESADLRIDATSVSRLHARLILKPESISITDLGSQNGTYVNEKRIAKPHPLHPGDVITIDRVTLILHATAATSTAAAAILPAAAFRGQLENEIDRAVRYERPFAVMCLLWPAAVAERAAIEQLAAAELRRIDALTWPSDHVMNVLLAETADDAVVDAIAKRLRSKLIEYSGELRIGYAKSGDDGFDPTALVATAEAAARGAASGDIAATRCEYHTITIGTQRVLIADPVVVRLYALIERLAPVDLPVLITGETGCGKELAATAIHALSKRSEQRLVSLNCAAIQETLVESELFGHERGAFSGAVATKAGLLEAASGSTLFLDEIGELSLGTQAKLLRVLEAQKFTRVGDVRERDIDVRIVAATNRDLEAEVEAGRFRQDLYFRLSGATLRLPPLRHRPRELPLLAAAFLDEACAKAGRAPMKIADDALAALLSHNWPGNVRELKNVMQYIAAAHPAPVVTVEHVTERIGRTRKTGQVPALTRPQDPASFRPLADEIRELEIARMRAALEATAGNQTRAAHLLSMPVRTFFEKVKHYGLQPRKKP